ncbi:GNAT family N-acetyltransferase [Salidesulfovibrio onnuriiensis]|uniref:GNAT family N-acetyltransferase n=1 Tax=Salidesulfovibrio onnuriiensis TaxID=2583823 RepID=UPI001C9C57E6|nr:GNAT family N-acetyltransferase [Salidesulfovibrio onnuriiensis]
MSQPVIRTMTRSDVNFAMGLAAAEGWNPGLSDGGCFFEADRNGFFLSELNGAPVASISAVHYNDAFGFVGLYIVVPEARHKGYGWELWRHAMAHLEGCNVGLDAVTEQEATYRRAGFRTHYRSARFQGAVGGDMPMGATPLSNVSFDQVLAYDAQCFPAPRSEFMHAWLHAPSVKSFGVLDGGDLKGFGVIRPCGVGYKIGPLFADDEATADTLFRALCASVEGGPVFLDVIEPNAMARALTKRYGMDEVFVTVRMYTRGEPAMDKGKIFGVTSFELG